MKERQQKSHWSVVNAAKSIWLHSMQKKIHYENVDKMSPIMCEKEREKNRLVRRKKRQTLKLNNR